MPRYRLPLALGLLAGVAVLFWLPAAPVPAQPKQREPAPEQPRRPTAEELAEQVNALRAQVNWLQREAALQNPAWFLSGDWELREARQGNAPVDPLVSGLSFTGQRVTFRYKDARGARTYTYRADPGSPLPTIDIYEPTGTVTLGAFSVSGAKAEQVTQDVEVPVVETKKEQRDGKEVEVPVTVMKPVRQTVTITVGTELRMAVDRGAGLRPDDLSGKDAGAIVWVFRRDGAFRMPPALRTPPLPAEVPAPPAPEKKSET